MMRTVFAAVAVFGLSITSGVTEELRGSARPPTRVIKGNLTLDEAVNVALRQNPEILKAIQEIERTRGQIIEVRAEALPQLTLTATYDQQDPRLLESNRGGGGNGGGGPLEIPIATGNGQAGGNGANGPGEVQTIDLSQLFQSSGDSSGGANDKSWRVAFEVRQVLYSGGRVRAALNIARLTEDSA